MSDLDQREDVRATSTHPSEVETQRRLKQVEVQLTREFPDLADWLVRREFRKVSAQLLARARFTEFVPLLAYRSAYEKLRDHGPGRPDETDVPAGVAARSA
jgi:hypothetical protein